MKKFFKPNKVKLIIFLLLFGIIYLIPYFNNCSQEMISLFPEEYETVCVKESFFSFILNEPNRCSGWNLCGNSLNPMVVIVKTILLSFLLFLYFVSCAIYHKVRKEDKRTKN